jgi:hypothetical protein
MEQAFLPAGLAIFHLRGATAASRQFNTGQESPVNPQTGMSTLLSRRMANPAVFSVPQAVYIACLNY